MNVLIVKRRGETHSRVPVLVISCQPSQSAVTCTFVKIPPLCHRKVTVLLEEFVSVSKVNLERKLQKTLSRILLQSSCNRK